MSNNRLWAVCKDDSEAKCLTKYVGGWGNIDNWETEDFMNKHQNCPSNHGCGENILFVTEQDDDRVELYDFSKHGETKIRIKNAKPSHNPTRRT